ncbi:hypothetical protein HHI36_018222 [Cryptolaemus montrouzieri]|uniref:Endonuclease/exonuclease/phosphatase domain-containing protein n=1 Tax=Cryptolaemus montrouzieri TaxID=559131 RepID=A0ABD2NZB6_9CUCU
MVHKDCAELSTDEFNNYYKKQRNPNGLRFLCPGCLPADPVIGDKNTDSLPADTMELRLFENIKRYFDVKLDSLTRTMRTENEKLFAEYETSNILVYNIEEHKSKNINERIARDMEAVSNIFKTSGIDESNLSKVIRVGRIRSKPRPIKAVLCSPQVVNDVIKHKKALLSKNIKIGLDRTKMQQDQLRTVLDEMKERTGRGEENLSLKYVNDVPTVSVNNVGGVRTRLGELNDSSNYDIILIVTWLNDDFLDPEVGFAGYNIFRMDRNPRTSTKVIAENNPDHSMCLFGDYNLPQAYWRSADEDGSLYHVANGRPALLIDECFSYLGLRHVNCIPNSHNV